MSDIFETKKITELSESTSAADSDLMMIGDPSTGELSKITKDNYLSEIKNDLTKSVGTKYFTSFDDLYDFAKTLDRYQLAFVFVHTTVSSVLGLGNGTSKGIITRALENPDSFDFFLWYTSGASVYIGRVQDGVTTNLYRYSGTSVSTTSATAENSVE